MLDHLSEGRFILGISPGALSSDAEVLGILDEDRNKMFAEAIDVILEIWKREPPYDIDLPDNRFKVSTARTQALHLGVGYLTKPYQQPRPEIVGTVLAPGSKGVIAMGERDFHPLSANFLLPKHLRSHWDNYVIGKQAAGQQAQVADWRVARTIFVADDEKTAQSYGGGAENSPYAFYFRQLLAKMRRSKRLYVFRDYPDQPDDDITLDYVLDNCVWAGTPNKIVDHILALHAQIGDFGELVYAGLDWVDPVLAKRSMQLMAEVVMPRVNAALAETKAA
jgi:alkanesulfonate monooxygenase SsuD/methylene tetrahydromethanopterin reductase-like flavin-dependent oxidoreductase (luciferase family)